MGNLRWASPQPAAAWTGVREASAPGSPCAHCAGSAPTRPPSGAIPAT
ncbi:hypothetical protein ABT024_12655 [Streptomyces sp. NPDC002812]